MDSIDPEVRQRLLADLLIEVLAIAPLRLALIGGQATNYWARPRYTSDFDFTVAADANGIERFVAELASRGFQVIRTEGGGSPSGPDFMRLERNGGIDAIDFIVAKTEFQDLVIERAVLDAPDGLPVATPEDMVILKLIANRSKDQRDIFTIVEAQPIDWDYVKHWAGVWEVTPALEKLLAELGLKPARAHFVQPCLNAFIERREISLTSFGPASTIRLPAIREEVELNDSVSTIVRLDPSGRYG
ncbi:MAG: nucleotidyl transferase AbiEii/AbiGii toxin family protein [bacterium]